MGRFDFSWDGRNPPKMLEYNADTPSLLLESSWVQGDWFKDKFGPKGRTFHQSNYLEEALDNAINNIIKICKKIKAP